MKLKLVCSLGIILLIVSSGCTYYRYAVRPHVWGMTIQESWDYDNLRYESGLSNLEARRAIFLSRWPISKPLDFDRAKDVTIDSVATPEEFEAN